MPWEVKKNGDQYCVYKIGGSTPIKGGCHPTREQAIKQQRALYANYNKESRMSELNSALAFTENAIMGDDGLLWMEALPAKTWYDPRWGEVPITKEKLDRFVTNFNEGVRGQEVTTDYEHGLDPAKGRKASGTYRQLEIRPRDDGTVSLWAGVEPTPTALNEIKNKEWKYFSVEWEDDWVHPETQEKHQDVIIGGALTNRPVAKGMLPINFSEVYTELSTEEKDAARLSAMQSKAKRVLNAKSMAEVLEIEAEHAPEYFQEPGTGIVDPSINADDSADKGWRVDTPPAGEDGSVPDRSDTVTKPNPEDRGGEEMTEEQLQELRKLIGLDADADVDSIIEGTRAMSEELEPLRELRKQTEMKKKFAEEYPDEAERLARLEKKDQENFAKQFSESFAHARVTRPLKVEGSDETKDEATTLGFSGLVLNEIEGVAKQFSEGKPTLEGFKGVVDAILNNGIVDYGNKGSERSSEIEVDDSVPASVTDIRKQFGERVDNIMKEDELDFKSALAEAAKRYPKLAEAWRQPGFVTT